MHNLVSTQPLKEHFQSTTHQPERFLCTQGFGTPNLTNSDRAQAGASLIKNYRDLKGLSGDSLEVFQDMISDLLHFMHRENIEPSQALGRSITQFITESSS